MRHSRNSLLTLVLALGACSSRPDHVPRPEIPAPHEVRYVVPPDTRQTYEPETQRFLDQEIQRKTQAPVQQPEPHPQEHAPRTVYADEPHAPQNPPYHEPPPRHTFPWYTAWGAGIGAVIGNQHHHQAGKGAWIGGGIGMLLDMASWRH